MYLEALALWKANAVFGTGLGVFFHYSENIMGDKYVIHSTPLWILTNLNFWFFNDVFYLF